MSIPEGIVRARRTAGVILLLSSLFALIAIVLLVGSWLTAPPTVHPLSTGNVLTTSGQASPPTVPPTVVVASVGSGTVSPHDQLVALEAQDENRVAAVPDGEWVPQVASNQVGTDRNGTVWDDASILADHLTYRQNYGGALLWSGDFATFRSGDYWVTIVPEQHSTSADAVLGWCASQQLDADHCYAKRLSRSSPYTGDNTKHPS